MTSPRASSDPFSGALSLRIPHQRSIGSSITSSTFREAAGRSRSRIVSLGIPGPDWALGRQGRGEGPSQNQFSLPDARDYQYQSLTASSRQVREKYTALMFRALGQVLHVVEDMAQPQHTRNDPHADCADEMSWLVGGHSWYEDYIEARTLRRPFPQEIPRDLVLGGYDAAPIRPYQEFFTENGRRGLADFSSRNFLSAGTNLADVSASCAGLPEPPCNATAYQQVARLYSTTTLKGTVSAPVTLYTRDVVDALTGQVIPNVPMTQPLGLGSAPSDHWEATEVQPQSLQLRCDGRHPAASSRRVCGRFPRYLLSRIHRRHVRGRAFEDHGVVRSDERRIQAPLRAN